MTRFDRLVRLAMHAVPGYGRLAHIKPLGPAVLLMGALSMTTPSHAQQVRPQWAPDLTVAVKALPGSTIFQVRVSNVGTMTAAESATQVVFECSSGPWIRGLKTPALAPGAYKDYVVEWPPGCPAGVRRVCATADFLIQVREFNETNNVQCL